MAAHGSARSDDSAPTSTWLYTWPGSNWRPSACWADVIATRPQVPIDKWNIKMPCWRSLNFAISREEEGWGPEATQQQHPNTAKSTQRQRTQEIKKKQRAPNPSVSKGLARKTAKARTPQTTQKQRQKNSKKHPKTKDTRIQKKIPAGSKPQRFKGVGPKSGEGPGTGNPTKKQKKNLQNGLKVFGAIWASSLRQLLALRASRHPSRGQAQATLPPQPPSQGGGGARPPALRSPAKAALCFGQSSGCWFYLRQG